MEDLNELNVGDVVYVKTRWHFTKFIIDRVTAKRAFAKHEQFYRQENKGEYKVVDGGYSHGRLETKELKDEYDLMVYTDKVDRFFRNEFTQEMKFKAYEFLQSQNN